MATKEYNLNSILGSDTSSNTEIQVKSGSDVSNIVLKNGSSPVIEKNIAINPVVNGVKDTSVNLYPKTKLENIVDLTTAQLTTLNSGITDSDVSNWNSKQDALPETVNDRYLHTNATTGALEWSEVDAEGIVVLDIADVVDNTLTDEQLAMVSGNNCVIKSVSAYFYKYTQTSSKIVYRLGAITNYITSGNMVAISDYEITVSTKHIELTTKTINLVQANPETTSSTDLTKIRVGSYTYNIPSAPTYTAGNGIDITSDVISVDSSDFKTINNESIIGTGNISTTKVTFVDWTVLTSYSGNITANYSAGGSSINTYIKFDTTPSSDNDYDSYCDYTGNITGLTSYSNKTKVYVWGTLANSAVTINNVTTSGGLGYSNAVEVTLTGNYDISLRCQSSGGSND